MSLLKGQHKMFGSKYVNFCSKSQGCSSAHLQAILACERFFHVQFGELTHHEKIKVTFYPELNLHQLDRSKEGTLYTYLLMSPTARQGILEDMVSMPPFSCCSSSSADLTPPINRWPVRSRRVLFKSGSEQDQLKLKDTVPTIHIG